VQCDACPADAIVDQPYRSGHLCAAHFDRSLRERVRHTLHAQAPGFEGGTIAVALSGGKDSAVALALTAEYFRRRPNVRLIALTVDEGIAGYRAGTIAAAKELTRSLGVEHRILSTESELGVTTDRAATRLGRIPPCSYCGVWRRQTLNRGAREEGAQVLVLGFNLDDLAQTVLMNLARGEPSRLARMAPHGRHRPGLVPRIAPLAEVPEREVYLFARQAGLPFDHGECPHAGAAARNVFREVLWRLEEELPGTRQALLRTRKELLAQMPEGPVEEGPHRCGVCGEPASGDQCRACDFRTRVLA
jgi:uncharacterized protein (TIGR00269 family)